MPVIQNLLDRHVTRTQPPKGKEIVNKELANSLQQKLEFSPEEFGNFFRNAYPRDSIGRIVPPDGLERMQLLQALKPNLSQHSYIKAGDRYFKPAAPTGLLYRGINGMSYEGRLLEFGEPDLPEHISCFDDFHDTCRGFVDFSFASATPDKHVALMYSGALDCEGAKCPAWNAEKGFCEEHKSTVLEIQAGQIDRGATLSWISQFPKESEHCLVPLSNFEVVGMRRNLQHEGRTYMCNVLETKLNLNQNAQVFIA